MTTLDTVGSAIVEQLNPGACRTYLIGSSRTREAALVDPVLGSIEAYRGLLAADGWRLRYVIDTHTHADHISGAAAVAEAERIEYLMHRRSPARRVSSRVSDGTTLAVGDLTVTFIETPGHTQDSVSLLVAGHLLTGDWLFIGGAGRTDLPGGDPGEHWDSIQRVVPRVDEDVRILPGHDYQHNAVSTLAREKTSNPHLRMPSRKEYVRWLSSAAQPTPEWMMKTLAANQRGVTDPRVNFMPPGEAACSTCQLDAPAPASVPEISPEDVRALIEQGQAPFLLDVRQPEEFVGTLGHVPGAVLIPLRELPARLSELELRQEKAVVAICRTGARSAQAADLLLKSGFTKVFNMIGGTLAWSQKGFPVER